MVAGGNTAPSSSFATATVTDVDTLRWQVSPPPVPPLSLPPSPTMKNLSISFTPPIVVIIISARARLTCMHQVQDLCCELESANNHLLKVEADASASRIELARCNNLIERQATERVRLVKEELRRT